MFRGWKPLCELQLISRAGRSLCVMHWTSEHSVGQQTAGSAALRASQVMQVVAEIRGRDNVHAPQWKEPQQPRGTSLWMDCCSLEGTLYTTHSSLLILLYISQFVRGRLCQNRRLSVDTCEWHLLSYLQTRKEVLPSYKSEFKPFITFHLEDLRTGFRFDA